MHAASVYPEPGSNSLKKYLSPLLCEPFFLVVWAFALSYLDFPCNFRCFGNSFCSISTAEFSSISLCFRLSLFNFQSAVRCPFSFAFRRDSLSIISQLFPLVKRFCKTFFKFLFPLYSPAFLTARLLYHKFSGLSRGFAKVFQTFSGILCDSMIVAGIVFYFLCRPSDSLAIISSNFPLVNPLLFTSPFSTTEFRPFSSLVYILHNLRPIFVY